MESSAMMLSVSGIEIGGQWTEGMVASQAGFVARSVGKGTAESELAVIIVVGERARERERERKKEKCLLCVCLLLKRWKIGNGYLAQTGEGGNEAVRGESIALYVGL